MIVLANTLSAVALVLGSLLSLYFWIVIIAALLTWVRPDPYNPIVRALRTRVLPCAQMAALYLLKRHGFFARGGAAGH